MLHYNLFSRYPLRLQGTGPCCAKTLVLRAIADFFSVGGATLCLGTTELSFHFRDQLCQQLVDRFKRFAVTLLGELQIIPHVVVGDALVNLDKNGASSGGSILQSNVCTFPNPLALPNRDLCDASCEMHHLHDVLQLFETSLKNRIVKQ